jgi:hypothetical protein
MTPAPPQRWFEAQVGIALAIRSFTVEVDSHCNTHQGPYRSAATVLYRDFASQKFITMTELDRSDLYAASEPCSSTDFTEHHCGLRAVACRILTRLYHRIPVPSVLVRRSPVSCLLEPSFSRYDADSGIGTASNGLSARSRILNLGF